MSVFRADNNNRAHSSRHAAYQSANKFYWLFQSTLETENFVTFPPT